MKFWGLFDIDIFSCIYFAYISISFQLALTCGTVRRRNATHRVRCRVVCHALYKTMALPGASIFRPLLRRVSVCNRNAYFYYRCLSVVTCTESDQVVLFDCLQKIEKRTTVTVKVILTVFQNRETLYFLSKICITKTTEKLDRFRKTAKDCLNPLQHFCYVPLVQFSSFIIFTPVDVTWCL